MKALILASKTYLLLTLISGLIILADSIGILNLPKQLLQTLTSPISLGLYQTSRNISHQFEFVFVARRLAQENKAQQEQLADLFAENSRQKTKIEELEALTDQKLSPTTFNLKPARVVGMGRYLLIDQGSQDGITVGQVIVYKDNFIGQVKAVSLKSSQVILSSDPESKIAAFASSGGEKARGIITGQFGQELLFDKVLHTESIKIEDTVYSEGTEGKLPRGLIIGKVTSVDEKVNETFKQAKVKPVFNPLDLPAVFIITN